MFVFCREIQLRSGSNCWLGPTVQGEKLYAYEYQMPT